MLLVKDRISVEYGFILVLDDRLEYFGSCEV